MTGLGLGLLLAATTAPACPSFPTDPVALIPADATTILGLDVDAFAKTTVGKALLPALRADLQLAEGLEILDDCGVALERTYSLLAARDDDDGRALIVQGRGLGEDATLACLAAELRARNDGVEPWTRSAHDCGDRLELGDGSRVWIGNAYTLVWAGGDWVATIDDALAGAQARAAAAPSLASPLARIDRQAQLWLAAALSPEDRRSLPGGWAREATTVTAAVDLDGGLQATLTFTAEDVAGLVSLRERIIADLLGLGDRLDEYGVDHQVRERARVGIVDDDFVAATLVLDAGELRAIREQIGERIIGRGPL